VFNVDWGGGGGGGGGGVQKTDVPKKNQHLPKLQC
jgi:hypothetical protein